MSVEYFDAVFSKGVQDTYIALEPSAMTSF